MKLPFIVLASSLLTSCAMHFHFHDMRPDVSHETSHGASSRPFHSARSPNDRGTVEGVVVDPTGHPIRARIAAVVSGGSNTTSTDDRGRFAIKTPSDDYVLSARTDSALIALERQAQPSQVIELKLRPGGTLLIDLEGREATRCAIFAQHLRFEDFTVRAGRTWRVVVPAGEVRVRLYEGNEVFAEREFDIGVGESKVASFKLDS